MYLHVCVCSDINECAIDNGGCAEVCENTDGSFFCACDGDEKVLSSDGKSCVGTYSSPFPVYFALLSMMMTPRRDFPLNDHLSCRPSSVLDPPRFVLVSLRRDVIRRRSRRTTRDEGGGGEGRGARLSAVSDVLGSNRLLSSGSSIGICNS